MGIVTDLCIRAPRESIVARSVRWAGSTVVGAGALARVMPALDRAALRASRGRTTASEWVAGVPLIHLTTTGARSGMERTAALVAVVVGEDLAVIGSNWGRGSHPAWVHNLAADPRATVTHRGRSLAVLAREATGDDAERIWTAAARAYRSFRTYPTRTGGRVIRVFLLEPR